MAALQVLRNLSARGSDGGRAQRALAAHASLVPVLVGLCERMGTGCAAGLPAQVHL